MELKIEPNSIKGFIEDKEGEALYKYALEYSKKGNCLEIGSYCGKSALYIGSAVKKNSKLLYSIDHHQGSEEQQPGEEYHDPDLLNIVNSANIACGYHAGSKEIIKETIIKNFNKSTC